jgi:hypothetical protein
LSAFDVVTGCKGFLSLVEAKNAAKKMAITIPTVRIMYVWLFGPWTVSGVGVMSAGVAVGVRIGEGGGV